MKARVLISAIALAFGTALPAAAHTTLFTATLTPEVAGATGAGFVSVEYDHDGHTFVFNATFSGLSGTTTIAHIHCCTANPGTGTVGVAVTPGTLPNFPPDLTTGTYGPQLVNLALTSSYTSAFLLANGNTAASAEVAVIAGIHAGTAYFNIHTSTFPGGEIRGFLAPVPEPETYALMLAGLGMVGWVAARRRKVGV